MQAVCFCHRRAKGMKSGIGKIQIKIVCFFCFFYFVKSCENIILTNYMFFLRSIWVQRVL